MKRTGLKKHVLHATDLGSREALQLRLFDRSESLTVSEAHEPQRPVPPAQPAVPMPVDDALRERLQRRVDFAIARWVWTDNKTTFLSCRRLDGPTTPAEDERWCLRVHRAFAAADEQIVDDLATFLSRSVERSARRRALAQLRQYFAEHEAARPIVREAPGRLRTRGAQHDLAMLLERVRRHPTFDGSEISAVRITWGSWSRQAVAKRRRARAQRTAQLGSYVDSQKLIRIHPVLDRLDVPEPVVCSVIFHELLHAVVPIQMRGTRRLVHSPRFRELERTDPHHAATEAWIQTHLFRILRRRRS
jgi:hypothetical protein